MSNIIILQQIYILYNHSFLSTINNFFNKDDKSIYKLSIYHPQLQQPLITSSERISICQVANLKYGMTEHVSYEGA